MGKALSMNGSNVSNVGNCRIKSLLAGQPALDLIQASRQLGYLAPDAGEPVSGAQFVVTGGVIANVGTHAMPSDDQSLFTQNTKCALHGSFGYAVFVGQAFVARKLLSWLELLRFDGRSQTLCDLLIRRARVVYIESVHGSQDTTCQLS
jgi:hypothetical protein